MEAATTVREGVISLPETLNDPAANVAASTRLRNNLVPFLRRETASSLLPVGKLQLSALYAHAVQQARDRLGSLRDIGHRLGVQSGIAV